MKLSILELVRIVSQGHLEQLNCSHAIDSLMRLKKRKALDS